MLTPADVVSLLRVYALLDAAFHCCRLFLMLLMLCFSSLPPRLLESPIF